MALSILKKMLKKGRAVYWAPKGVDDFGQPKYDEPVEIKCRWEDRNEQFINQAGEQVVSKSIVYVDRKLQLGGMLAKGTLENLTSQTVPANNPDSGEIRGWGEVPNINQDKFLRWAML